MTSDVMHSHDDIRVYNIQHQVFGLSRPVLSWRFWKSFACLSLSERLVHSWLRQNVLCLSCKLSSWPADILHGVVNLCADGVLLHVSTDHNDPSFKVPVLASTATGQTAMFRGPFDMQAYQQC